MGITYLCTANFNKVKTKVAGEGAAVLSPA